jgi:hypothetical protein
MFPYDALLFMHIFNTFMTFLLEIFIDKLKVNPLIILLFLKKYES